jgi:membrane-associated phospholipid phosphatase
LHINPSPHLSWPAALKDKDFKRKFFVSIFLLIAVLVFFFFILQYAENRNGITIEKGWLNGIIASTDFSGWIFALMYGATILGLIFCFRKPATALLLIRTYLLLQFLRALTLLLIPLDPPEGIIPLEDPFLRATFYNGRANLKDLFFSGHVATLIMFIPVISNKWIRWLLAIVVLAVGILLVAQRVHYIVDVIAAPVFAVIAFYLAKRWSR